jgi:hypothetical protein
MASPERNISAGSPAGVRPPSVLDERLASLEDEATRLRAEVAALQDEIRWLTGEDEPPAGLLARGWVRASLLLTAVGMVVLVSLPYLLHSDPSGPTPDPTPRAATRSAPTAPRATVEPAPVKAAGPASARVRAPEVPEPARVLSADDQAGAAPRPRPARERRAAPSSAGARAAPAPASVPPRPTSRPPRRPRRPA